MVICPTTTWSFFQEVCQGSAHLRDNPALISEIKAFDQAGKKITAICAAPIALHQAGVLKGKHFTCYDGVQEQITDGIYQKSKQWLWMVI